MDKVMLFIVCVAYSTTCVLAGKQLSNVLCRLNPTVVATEPNFAHYPYFVTLHRCTGSWGNSNPSIIECVASETEEVTIKATRFPGSGSMGNIKLINHTRCTSGCVVKASQCSKYETYDAANCRCQCPYQSAPVQCPALMEWDSRRCQCTCVSRIGTCPSGMIWSDTKCGCGCPERKARRCQRNQKVLDERTCTCVARGMIRPGGPMKSEKSEVSGSKISYWYYIVVAEFFVMLLVCDAILYRKKSGMTYKIITSTFKSGKLDFDKPEIVVVHSNENQISSCRSSQNSLTGIGQETKALLPLHSVEHL